MSLSHGLLFHVKHSGTSARHRMYREHCTNFSVYLIQIENKTTLALTLIIIILTQLP